MGINEQYTRDCDTPFTIIEMFMVLRQGFCEYFVDPLLQRWQSKRQNGIEFVSFSHMWRKSLNGVKKDEYKEKIKCFWNEEKFDKKPKEM